MTAVHSADATVRGWTLPPSWPVWAATAAYPVWWALGVTTIIYPLLVLPLSFYLYRMRPLKLPRGWLLGAMFLGLVLVSSVMLNVDAPATAVQHGIGPYGAYVLRFLGYASAAMLMLYVGNQSERVLPVRTVVVAMSVLGGAVGLLGLAGTFFQSFSFRAPASYFLPSILVGNGQVSLAQVQDILGEAAPRPSAPFDYTNTWGEVLSMLLVWMAVHAIASRRGKRLAILAIVALSAVPILASLNRGVWIGIILTIAYVAVRLALRGRLALVACIVVAAAVGGGALAVTSAGDLIQSRVETGHSDEIRENLAADSIRLATDSPIIGYGSTRRTQGSYESIAIGPSADCTQCGERVIGSTGQLWLLLVAQGWLGTGLYFGFFLYNAWRYRKDNSPVGIAASTVVLLSVFYSYFYSALGAPLTLTMLAVALLWRNDQERRRQVLAPDALGAFTLKEFLDA